MAAAVSVGELAIVVLVVLASGFPAVTMRFFVVASASMEPTLRVGDRVLVVRRPYIGRAVRGGDVVVACDPTSEAQRHVVKRVVAVAGDSVKLVDGSAEVNGAALREPYVVARAAGDDFAPIRVPEGCVFVLGDDRRSARDSRDFGPLPIEEIVGKAVLVVSPPARLGRI